MIEYVDIDEAIAREGERFELECHANVPFVEAMERLEAVAVGNVQLSFADAGREAYGGFVSETAGSGQLSEAGRSMTKAYILARMKERGAKEVSNYALEVLGPSVRQLEAEQQRGFMRVWDVALKAGDVEAFEDRLRDDYEAWSAKVSPGSLVRVREGAERPGPVPEFGPGYVDEVYADGHAVVRFPSKSFFALEYIPADDLERVDWTGAEESWRKAVAELSESRSALAQYQAEMVNLARELGLDPDVSIGDPMYYGDMVSEALEELKAENALLKVQLSGKKAGKVPARESKAKTPETQEKKAREAAARPEGFDIKVGKVHWR